MDLKIAMLETEKKIIKEFLDKFELGFEKDIEFSIYIVEFGDIIGTISISKNIIKSFAVDPKYKGQVASLLVSEAINNIYKNGYNYYRVYTKPQNKDIFLALNFYEIISSDKVSLLESKNRNITNVLNKIKHSNDLASLDTAAIVMNCNPFTLGHRYLIEQASKKHKLVIVFLVEEQASTFKFKDRLEMVKRGTKDLENIRVIPSTDYLISSLTFPSYFLKKEDSKIYEQALLDSLIFKNYFIPIFNLKKRYLGTEEDLVTNKYNQTLKGVLGELVEVVPRIKYNNEIISASRVRNYLENNEFEKIKNLVPLTTYDYLKGLYE